MKIKKEIIEGRKVPTAPKKVSEMLDTPTSQLFTVLKESKINFLLFLCKEIKKLKKDIEII